MNELYFIFHPSDQVRSETPQKSRGSKEKGQRKKKAIENKQPSTAISSDIAEKFSFEDEFALLVFLRCLVGLVVLPAHRLFALTTGNVANDVAASCHVALIGSPSIDIDDTMKEIGLAVLATEIL